MKPSQEIECTCGHCGHKFRAVPEPTHRVLCGDSTDAAQVERLMDGKKADLFISDPPYGVGYVEKARDMNALGYVHSRASLARLIDNDQRTETDEEIGVFLTATLTAWWPDYLKPGGTFYLCSPAGNTETTYRNVVSGFCPIRQCIVWIKDNFVIGRQDYHWRHESILYGWTKGSHFFCKDRTQDTVWEYNREQDKLHPTIKPLAMIKRMIENSSVSGSVVIDPFLGSGSVVVAAEQTDRQALGMELQPAYVDVIVRRWQEFTGKAAHLEGGGTFDEVADERLTQAAEGTG